MDAVAMVVQALAVGAGTDRADTAGREAYRELKRLVLVRFRGRHRAVAVLADHEEDPETYERPMAKMVRDHGVADDEAVLAAAARLLEQADARANRGG